MLTRTSKRVKIKGRLDSLVREVYLRDDIHCHSPLCTSCAPEKGCPFFNFISLLKMHYHLFFKFYTPY